MWALKLLLVLAAGYAAVVLVAYSVQTWLLFPTSSARGATALPAGAERISCETQDGERLQGVRIPVNAPAEGRTILIGFGGNAWNAEHMAGYLHELFPAAEVVVFHYRGYRPSTGRPSAAALLEDSPRVYDCATSGRGAAHVVAAGFSIGSGVATHLARERPLDGVILVTPFDTLEKLARQHYGWMPVGLLLRHHMSPVEDLREVSAPIALIAAERDTIIPAQRTAPLRNAARALIMNETVRGAGHNDIYSNPEFARAMRRAMKLIRDRAKLEQSKRDAATKGVRYPKAVGSERRTTASPNASATDEASSLTPWADSVTTYWRNVSNHVYADTANAGFGRQLPAQSDRQPHGQQNRVFVIRS